MIRALAERARTVRVRALAIPLLVVALAAFHAVRTVAYDQSSWGAGQPLGMFGRLDSHGSRTLRVRSGDSEVAIPAELHDLADHARVVPDEVSTLGLALARRHRGPLEVTLVAADGRVIRRVTIPGAASP